jgi:tetratricopeptide (TPR) repeat protein
MAFRFLDLPAELRTAVYDQVLNPAAFRRERDDGTTFYACDLALLRVNRQVHREAREALLRNCVFVRIQTPWDRVRIEQVVHVSVLAMGWLANDFADVHLAVSIDASSEYFDRQTRQFLILADDLPAFNQLWHYSELTYGVGLSSLNMDLALTLELKNPLNPALELPFALQRRLFASFGLLKRINSLTIIGPHSLYLESELQKAIAAPDATQEECLELATKFKDAGNAELNNNNPTDALKYYIESFRAMHVVCFGRYRYVWADAWFDRVLEGGRYDRQHGQFVRIVMRVHLVSKVIRAFLELGDYEEAFFWGNRTLNTIRQATGNEEDLPMLSFPAASDLGMVLFRTGLACRHLGRTEQAKRLYFAARPYLPQDEDLKGELTAITFGLSGGTNPN